MTLEAVFSVASALVMPVWALLALLPGRRWVTHVLAPVVAPALLAALYAAVVLTSPPGDGGFGSLAEVRRLFASDHALLAGWVHYLAFDLFVGAWEVRDARRVGVPHLAVVPCLGLTLMLGPLGLLAYLALRAVVTRDVTTASAVG